MNGQEALAADEAAAQRREALAAYFRLVGESLSERIARLWPTLGPVERRAVEDETTEDGMRALLAEYEAAAQRRDELAPVNHPDRCQNPDCGRMPGVCRC